MTSQKLHGKLYETAAVDQKTTQNKVPLIKVCAATCHLIVHEHEAVNIEAIYVVTADGNIELGGAKSHSIG